MADIMMDSIGTGAIKMGTMEGSIGIGGIKTGTIIMEDILCRDIKGAKGIMEGSIPD
ncbi:hypothetical protein GCM10008013_08780 [Paenibacillus segetis]|uniref:Uncharacterized protein n=1 Tax=Paenibacillus segetis TaxID=1325360 RepID=A0ABQ1Y811_9BACL|nr:hypothetical protein GCM10008013_08780 [Paenibacillus segetis]